MRTRLALVLLLGVVLLCPSCGGDDGAAGDPDAGNPPPGYSGDIQYSATHYDVALDLSTRKTKVDVTLHTVSDGDCVSIGMRTSGADAVSLGGTPAAHLALADGKLTACDGAGHGFASGSDVVLSVATEVPATTLGMMDVGFSTQTDAAGGLFTYLVSWLNGCDRHGPCDARPDAFATYRFVVTHDATTQVLCPGVLVETPTQTTCSFDYAGGPTYSTYGLMARSPAWTKLPLGDWNGVTATLYDRPGSMIATKLDSAQIGGQFTWLADKFGGYPYGHELRFAVAPTYWAGFEHPGNVALGDFLGTSPSSYSDGLQHTVMHELVHMWAGDQATLAGTYDFVWKEAMAEYLTFVYEDTHLAPGVGQATATYWKGIAPRSKHFPVPEDQPRPELAAYYGDAYGPGPMILFRQLEAMYGRDKVLDALVALIGTGHARVLSVADVQTALEVATGHDLEKYFQAWMYGSGIPTYPVATASFEEATPGAWRVRGATTSADGVERGCAFHVRLLGAGGVAAGESVDVPFSNGPDGGEYPTPDPVTLSWVPVSLVVDPLHECLVYTPAMLEAPPPARFW